MSPRIRSTLSCYAVTVALSLMPGLHLLRSQEVWSDKDTRLANEYLGLLVDQPEYGRVVDLLWELYRKRDSTALLLENIRAQAAASGHPSVLLVEAHLVRRSGDTKRAAELYDAILKQHPDDVLTLRARSELAIELGDTAGAMQVLKRLLTTLPDTDATKPAVWMQLGDLTLVSGTPEDAAKAWESALKLAPGDAGLVRTVAQHLLRAGFPERAAAPLEKLALQPDPVSRLEALLELSRIHEHADQLPKADEVLKKALALLDFRDARYQQLMQRRVRLHERFGSLEELRNQLSAAALKTPPVEQALYDMSRFHALTAEPEEQLAWLRKLVEAAPTVEQYRLELVRTLLDHEGAAEAAALLDARQKESTVAAPALVLLRAEADLRQNLREQGIQRLAKLLRDQPLDLEIEKEVLAFAQGRSLDPLVEQILKARMQRDPTRPEPVFELAAFHRSRNAHDQVTTLLQGYAKAGVNAAEQARRHADAAAFLSAGGNAELALTFQREAARLGGGEKDQLVKLADYLLENGEEGDVIASLETAVKQAATPEERTDIDERLFSLLMGTKPEALAEKPEASSDEFRLPGFLTGEGFGSDQPVAVTAPQISERALKYADGLILAAERATASAADLQRAIWWAHHTEKRGDLYRLLRKLLLPAPSVPPDAALQRFLLDIALAEENHFFATRLLRDLARQDAPNRVQYLLRLAEIALHYQRPGMLPDRAIHYLKEALRERPDSEPVLSALSQCYVLNGRLNEAIDLWKAVVERARGSSVVPLRERYAELLLRGNRMSEYVENHLALLEAETDIKRRREHFKRFVDRFTFSDARGGELAEAVLSDRLKLLETRLLERTRRHPFDGFYQEALAVVYERRTEDEKAFKAMRQAYYTSPDTPFSLEQLRDSALRSADSKAAIYFQKQIVASATAADVATESRRLVQMLEGAFQIAEADKVRRRLESRFSQDAAALEDLARHYRETGQDEAERRVYEQIQKVKSWDARSTLRLALKCLTLADEAAAVKHLEDLLARTQTRNSIRTLPPERWPFPLVDERPAESGNPLAEIAGMVGETRILEETNAKRLRAFLNHPRPEFQRLPDDVSLVRLRGIEELARVLKRQGGVKLAAWIKRWQDGTEQPAIERLWALYYADAGKPFHDLLLSSLEEAKVVDLQFVKIWLLVKAHGIDAMIEWLQKGKKTDEQRQENVVMVQLVLELLAERGGHVFHAADLKSIGRSTLLRTSTLISLLRRLQDSESYEQAMVLAECLRDRTPELYSYYSFVLANFAQSAEDSGRQRRYLYDVLRGPLTTGSATMHAEDAFVLSVVTLHRLAATAQERQDILSEAQARVASSAPSSLNDMRKAALASLAGAKLPASERMSSLLGGTLFGNRVLSMSNGGVMPHDPFASQEASHLRGYWEDVRLLSSVLAQQGLGGLMAEVDDHLEEKMGGAQLGPRTGDTFAQWRSARLIRHLRESDFPTRLRLIREHLAAVDKREEDAVEALSELGRELEVNGMLRECIEVYKDLPARAPTNNAYAEYFIRVCEQSLEPVPARKYVESLFGKDPLYKPQGIGDETLREKHARFLAMEHDAERLRELGWKKGEFSRVLPGRIPPEIPYLRELALLLEKRGDKSGALVAWERFHEVWVNGTPQQPLATDLECALHRARLHEDLGTRERAYAIVSEVKVKATLDERLTQILELRARLAAQLGKWEAVQPIKSMAVDRSSMSLILSLSTLLDEHQRRSEALSFVTQAERSAKGGEERFKLRLELLKLLAKEPTWSPATHRPHIAAIFRTQARDETALKGMSQWLSQQAETSHADAWVGILQAEHQGGPDPHLAALALSNFTTAMNDRPLPDAYTSVWRRAAAKDRVCMTLTARSFLDAGKNDWAWAVCEALRDVPASMGSRIVPLAVEVAAARGKQEEVQALFDEVIRQPIPGGRDSAAWARAFETAGRADLAAEVFDVALHRVSQAFVPGADLVKEHLHFLIRQKQFEKAERHLVKHYAGFMASSATVIVELYREWGRLDQLARELPKYYLPLGVENEVWFLAKLPRP